MRKEVTHMKARLMVIAVMLASLVAAKGKFLGMSDGGFL